MPLEHLSTVLLLVEAIRPRLTPNSVIVSPDLGAVKLAEEYARLLSLPMVIAHKSRLSGSEVAVQGLVGDVRGRAPIIVDDLISTGGTIAAVGQLLIEHGALSEFTVVASHALLAGKAVERMKALPVRQLVTTDSLPPKTLSFPSEVVSLAPLLAQTIRRLHQQ
jgi:ribose-phosphate pyrophosphokinase